MIMNELWRILDTCIDSVIIELKFCDLGWKNILACHLNHCTNFDTHDFFVLFLQDDTISG